METIEEVNYEMERVENLYKELKLVGELHLENL